MTKEVLITICGLQNGPDADGEPIEMTTTGEYFYKNGKHYVLYEEVTEGETKTTKNRIKIAPGYLELTKNGVVNTHMLFEEHKKNVTHYYTPYGSLMMGIDTKSILVEEEADVIKVVADYALDLNQEFAADCDIKITIQSKGIKEFKLS